MRDGARQSKCAETLGLSPRTLKRWRAADNGTRPDGRPTAKRPTPPNALTPEERTEILRQCNRSHNASKPPAQIVVELADEGTYIASEASFYRVLREARQQHYRGRARAPKTPAPKATHTASAPNQVWCWDITWLASTVAGRFFKLYIILDLFSRKIVASEVWEEENAEHSQTLLRRACLAENIAAKSEPLVLHGDNGSPLKATTVLALMHQLGTTPSHSRPRVSNDNPHAEAFFRTGKYHPSLPPGGFATVEEARAWAHRLIQWCNHQHRHSALRFVTPAQKHRGEDVLLLAKRKTLYEAKCTENPGRWIQRKTRNWQPVTTATLNPVSSRKLEKKLKNIA
jgi:putative transposase